MTQPDNTEYPTRPNGYLKDFVCRKCKEDIKLSNIDDTGEPFFNCPNCGILNKTEIKKLDENAKCGECVFWRSSACPDKPRSIDFNAFFLSPTQTALCAGRYFEQEQPKRKTSNYSKMRVSSQINPVLLAKDIMVDYTFVVEKQSRILFIYEPENGKYSEHAEETIKREIAKRLDDNARSKFFNDVHFFIRATAPIKPFCDIGELLLCENGILNILTRELKPFSPEYFIVNKIPVKYDPEATCPKNDEFFNQVLPKLEIKTLFEFWGYALFRKITFHKAVLLVGTGRNGKGVTLNIITAFLGKENCSSETLQSLCYNRFSTANLYCKLANISADLPSSIIKNTGIFKMIVGGDTVPNERKCVTAYPYNPYVKNLFSANYIPPISNTEDCDAFYARWLIFEFKKQFLGEKADKQLIQKLITPEELSGLLNRALDGFDRLNKNKDFSMRENIAEMRKQYIKRSNSVQAFIEECIEVTADFNDILTSKYLYTKFLDYCNQNQIKSKSQREFIANMKEHCLGTDFRKTRLSEEQKTLFCEDKNTTNAWHYIKFVPYVPFVPTPLDPYRKLCNFSTDIQGGEQGEQEEQKTLNTLDSAFPSQCFLCNNLIHNEDRLEKYENRLVHKKCKDRIEVQKKKKECKCNLSDSSKNSNGV